MAPAETTAQLLERQFAALCEEIRRYPAPIARCDEQLAALLERRAATLAQLDALRRAGPGCNPINVWINDGGTHAA